MLKKRSENMETIARVAGHLNFLLNLGVAVSEVRLPPFQYSNVAHRLPFNRKINPVAKVLFAVLRLGFDVRASLLNGKHSRLIWICFQKFSRVSDNHARLKNVALECMANIESNQKAREAFTTDFVRDHLKTCMVTTVDALVCISCHYKKSRSSA